MKCTAVGHHDRPRAHFLLIDRVPVNINATAFKVPVYALRTELTRDLNRRSKPPSGSAPTLAHKRKYALTDVHVGICIIVVYDAYKALQVR